MAAPIKAGDRVRVLRNRVNAVIPGNKFGLLKIGDIVEVRRINSELRQVIYTIRGAVTNYLPYDDVVLVDSSDWEASRDVLSEILGL